VQFFLGTHLPNWLERTDVPLFVSTRRLSGRKTLPIARGPVAIDSSGYSELSLYGDWRIAARQYVADVRRYESEIGQFAWAAVQDWMCEPWVLHKTGLSIKTHQALTIASLLELRDRAPDIAWAPVLQGWHLPDYVRHIDAYAHWGIDLTSEPVIGVGSVCRRQGTQEAVDICRALSTLGLRLHGFGIKKNGLFRLARYLASADSMAWSFDARRKQRPECGSVTHKNCANCLVYALRWRDQLLRRLRQPDIQQLRLPV
jgi:hypothetical protein